jgi:hypothetical protein
MKKANLLSKAEMKKVMGGYAQPETGICDDWAKAEKSTCYNCCITVRDLDECATKCGF